MSVRVLILAWPVRSAFCLSVSTPESCQIVAAVLWEVWLVTGQSMPAACRASRM